MSAKRGVLALSLSFLLLTTFSFAGFIEPACAAPIEIQVALELSTYSIEIPASPNEDTSNMLTGTVSITEKNLAESVIVQLSILGDSWTYGTPDPGTFIFQQIGTQSFNLTIFLKEDAPPGGVYQVGITAFASSTLDSAEDNRLLKVIPTWYQAS